MNKFKNAAIEILDKVKAPLHYKEITQQALEAGLLETDGATPELSMNAQLSVDIKQKGTASEFIRVSPGVFSLNPNKKETTSIATLKIAEQENSEDEKIQIDGSFTGKAGEHLVCAELLFRGYNASIMSVDVGMDITATNEHNKLFSIQVKTANINKFNIYVFDVRVVSFEREYSGNIFYVFVLRGDKEYNFLILPQYEMEKKMQEKSILKLDHGKKYRVNIKFKAGNIYLGNLSHEVNYYLNNWQIIK
jgi:hypothetical protein